MSNGARNDPLTGVSDERLPAEYVCVECGNWVVYVETGNGGGSWIHRPRIRDVWPHRPHPVAAQTDGGIRTTDPHTTP